MHRVSLFIELIRTRPVAIFWAAALTQAALWTLVPSLFYAAPPGELAEMLAVAHETGLGNPYGPPLAYWLAEGAFRIGGMFAVYLLAQVCVLVILWAVFSLGRIVVGPRHAVLAVLLMAGIAAFSVPTPEFSPAIARGGAVGADAAALLAGSRAGAADLLARGRLRGRSPAAHRLFRCCC